MSHTPALLPTDLPKDTPAVSSRGVSRKFGSLNALTNVTFDIPAGSICGLIGPNGAGKTTLLRILAGLDEPDVGTRAIDGVDLAVDPAGARNRFGYVPDYAGLYDSLTVRELVHFFGSAQGVPQAQLGGAVDRVSAALELQHRTYMNWHEAGTGLSANKNYYTKDYNALKLSVSERSPVKAPLVWNAGFTWLLKAYTDSYVVKKVDGANGPTTDGTLDLDMLRADHLLRLAGDLSWAPGANFILATDLGVDWNVSNQNYFDAVATRGTLDFYGYVNTGGGLKLTWLPSGEQGPRLSLRGGLGVRAYTGRLARTIGSGYFTSQQMDIEETLDLDSAWPLPVKGLAVVGGLGYDVVISNQSYSPGTLSNYQLFNASLGLQYKL